MALIFTAILFFSFGLTKDRVKPLEDSTKYPIYGRDSNVYEYYRNNFLDERQQKVYDNFLEAALQFKPRFYADVDYLTEDELKNIFYFLDADHPEVFWIRSYSCLTLNGKVYTNFNINIIYRYEKEEAIKKHNIIKEKYEPIIKEAMKYSTRRQKTDFVRKKLMDMSECYRPDSEEEKDFYCMVSIFEKGKSFCSGYSYSFKFLMDKLGIPAICVFYNGEGAHIWNMVELNNKWYNLDITYDDYLRNVSKDRYYLVDNETFYKDHHINEYLPNLKEEN